MSNILFTDANLAVSAVLRQIISHPDFIRGGNPGPPTL
jgi:hypothetical protein